MKKSIIFGAIAIIVIGVGSFLVFHKSSPVTPVSSTATTSTNQAATKPSSTPKSTKAPSAAGATTTPKHTVQQATLNPLYVTVSANDSSASPETVTAKNGQKVNITFAVSNSGTYHGGLDFKSSDPSLDSGPITQGSSKMVSFTATKSFQFTPFWYQSNVQKDYFVTVTVQ